MTQQALGLETEGVTPAVVTAPPKNSSATVALILGIISVFGIVLPPLIGCAIAGLILGWKSRRAAIAEGRSLWLSYLALGLSAIGALDSLVLPGFVIYVVIYALTHGNQLPPGAP
jgi:hypothetical protein